MNDFASVQHKQGKKTQHNTSSVPALQPVRDGDAPQAVASADWQSELAQTEQFGYSIGRMALHREDVLQQVSSSTSQQNARAVGEAETGEQREENRTGLPDALKAGVERFSGYSLSDIRVHYPVQRMAISAAYSQGQGLLKSDTSILAAKELLWFQSFTLEALTAIRNALNLLVPSTQQDAADIATIQQKLLNARDLSQAVNLEWIGDTVEAKLPGYGKVGECEFVEDDDEDDGRYWIHWIETNVQHRRRGVGVALIQAGVNKYGAVYASRASKQAHEQRDPDDTRWLTDEGAALVNACIKKGIMKQQWLVDPFFRAEPDSDDDDR